MERQYKGYFISLEGGEGSGKTTHTPPVVDHLRKLGLMVYPTREPGGTSIGEQIREVIHSMKNTEMHPRTETLLYQAARVEMVEQILKPKLKEGAIILMDRFFDSTLAYQGYGHRQDIGELNRLIKYATGGLTPDLTILLDIDAELGLSRKEEKKWNRMEALPLKFHKRVNSAYLEMARQEPDRWFVIDARRSITEVYCDLVREIDFRLQSSGFIERNGRGVER